MSFIQNRFEKTMIYHFEFQIISYDIRYRVLDDLILKKTHLRYFIPIIIILFEDRRDEE